MSPLLIFLLYNLTLMGIAHKKQVATRWYLIIAIASLIAGPAGLLAALAAKRFSKYQGAEYERRVNAHKIAVLHSKIMRNEILMEKRPILSSILISNSKNFELKEQLNAARQAYVRAGGDIKELENMLNVKKGTVKTPKPPQNAATANNSPKSKQDRSQQARNIYKGLITPTSSQSQSQSQGQGGIKR